MQNPLPCQARLESPTNGQAGELEQAVAELRENPYDLATLYNDFAVKYRVREAGNRLDVSTRRTQPWQCASMHCTCFRLRHPWRLKIQCSSRHVMVDVYGV